jgi:hypothetical protein
MPLVPVSDERAKSAKKLGLTSKLDDIDSIPVPKTQASDTAVNVSSQGSPLATPIAAPEDYSPNIPLPANDAYDSIIDEKQPDEYDQIIDGQRRTQRANMQGAMYVGAKAEPDREAKILQLSMETNLPPRIVAEQYDKLVQKKKVIGTDYDSIIDNTPGLAKWMEDPDNAKIAHDDLDGLGAIEQTVLDYHHGWMALNSLGAGISRRMGGVARIPNIAGAALSIPYNAYQKSQGGFQTTFPASNPIADLFDRAAEEYTSQNTELDVSVARELGKGNYSRAGTALGHQFISQIPQLAFTFATMGAGAPGAGLGILGASSAAEKNKELQEKGVEPSVAVPNALATGAIEAGTESLGTFRFIKNWGDALVKTAGKQGAFETFKGMWKVMLSGGATEGSEEAAAQLATSSMDYVTGVDPDAMKNLPENLLNSTILGVALGAGGAAPGVTVQSMAKVQRDRQTQQAKDFYLSLGETMEAAKLRKRLPEKQREFVEQLTQNSPVEFVYVAPEAVEAYFQSQKESPAKIMDELGVGQQYNEAKDTGQDVKIPLAVWANKFVGEDHYKGLQNDIKFDPAQLSINEKKAADEQDKADLAAEEKAAKTVDKDAEAGKVVVKDVEERLKAINADPTQAVLYRGFEVLGRRAGIDPLELYNRYQLRIGRGESPTEAMMAAQNQGQVFEQRRRVNELQEQSEFPIDQANVTAPDLDEKRDGPRQAFAVNAQTGWKIDIPSKGQGKAESQIKNDAGPIAIDNLDRLLESAVYFYREPFLGKGGRADPNIPWTHHFYVPFFANGKQALARLVVNETQMGKKFYHSLVVEKESGPTPPNERALPKQSASPRTGARPDAFSVAQLRDEINLARQQFPYFQAGDSAPRARISFNKSRQFNIDLLAGADPSSFMHETGHFYLEVLGDLFDDIQKVEEGKRTDRQRQILADYESVLSFLGAKSRSDVTREMHEKWADAFEDYLHEGKAPNSRLREAFARFKAWLTMVYRVVQRNNVQLTPEVRSIMDRLLATEEEIEAAQQEVKQAPLFADPKAMGMSDAKAQKYIEATYWAREHAKEEVNAKLLKHHERQRSKAWAEEKESLKPEIEKEVSARQVYVAIDRLTNEKLPDGSPLKLHPASVAEFGEDLAKSLPKGVVATKKSKQGLDATVAAELLGYGSAQELITALTNVEDKAELVERLAEEEMQRRNPDFLNDAQLPVEVMEAVHNQSREKMLRMELEHLASQDMPVLKEMIRRVAKRVPSEKAVKEQARQIIGAQQLSEISAYTYQLAEAKAAKEAGVLLAKGDFDGAFQAKRRELLNFELYRMAKGVEDQIEKSRNLFKKLRGKDEDIAKSRNLDMVNAGRSILASFGIGKADKSPESYLESLQKYDPEAHAAILPLVQSATSGAAPLEEVTFNDFVALHDAVKALWDISKTAKELDREGKKIELAQAVEELKTRVNEKTGDKPQPGLHSALSEKEKRSIAISGLVNLATRVEAWAYAMDRGNPDGPFTKYLVRPVLEATTKYRLKRIEAMKELSAIVQKIKVKDSKAKIAAPEIGYEFTKPELLMALLHSGNDSNLRKLLDGRNWGEVDEDGNLDRSKWDAFMLRAMTTGIITKADMDAAQAIWDLNEKLKPDAQKAHKAMFGYYFDEITANEIQTPWGVYRGGYMPAVADRTLSVDSSIREGQQALEDTPYQMFPTTGRGFTKKRAERYTTPLSLDFTKLKNHLDKVLKFTYIEPAIKDASKIINNREFRGAINRYDADAADGLLIPWLKRAATQRSSTPGFSKTIDNGAMAFRRSSSMQIMVLNVVNAIQNTTALIPSMVRVSPKFLGGSLKRYLSAPRDYAATAIEVSDFMKTRIGENAHDATKEIEDFIVNPSKLDDVREFTTKHGYALDRLTNGMAEVVVWGGAFEEAKAKGMEHKDAVAHADATVRQALAGMNPEDIARFESGSPFVRLFTMFSSFFNTQANLLGAELSIAKEQGGSEGAVRAGKAAALVVMVPAIVSSLIFRVMAGKGLDEDDDGEYIDDFFDITFGAPFRYMTAMVPGGQLINSVVNRFNDKPYDDKISLSPAFTATERALSAPFSAYKAIKGKGGESKAIKDGAYALGLATGLPVGAAARPLSYMQDVSSGKAKPSGPVDAARGIVTGYPGGR